MIRRIIDRVCDTALLAIFAVVLVVLLIFRVDLPHPDEIDPFGQGRR